MRPLFAVLVMAGFAFSGSSFAQENSIELEEHMQEMHALMERIDNEDSQARLQRLMNEHMALMHEGLALLDAGDMNVASLSAEQRVTAMERKVQIMQMMLTQLLSHQSQERRRPVHEHKRP